MEKILSPEDWNRPEKTAATQWLDHIVQCSPLCVSLARDHHTPGFRLSVQPPQNVDTRKGPHRGREIKTAGEEYHVSYLLLAGSEVLDAVCQMQAVS